VLFVVWVILFVELRLSGVLKVIKVKIMKLNAKDVALTPILVGAYSLG
jgi:hypothetical protein